MPAKKRAAAAAAAATEDINPIPPPATDDEASATATAKGKAKKAKKAEVVFVTERDPLQRKPSLPAGRGFKILSYNVNGLKALVAKDPGLLGRLAEEHSADMLLLQETKLQECFIPEYKDLVPNYFGYWSCSKTKKGYAGTATFVKACYIEGTPLAEAANAGCGGGGGANGNGGGKQQPTLKAFFGGKGAAKGKGGKAQEGGAPAAAAAATAGASANQPKALAVTYGIDGDGDDEEGRVITVELPNLFVVNVYVTNSGMKLERLDYRLKTANPRLQAYLERLKARKPVVLAGDLNVAHLDLDCYNTGAKHLPKVPGCTPQEREAQTQWLAEKGWVDAFRLLHPGARGAYTYWNVKTGARAENKGLRLDYFIMPAEDATGARGVVRVHDCGVLHDATTLSDHCPIDLTLELLDN